MPDDAHNKNELAKQREAADVAQAERARKHQLAKIGTHAISPLLTKRGRNALDRVINNRIRSGRDDPEFLLLFAEKIYESVGLGACVCPNAKSKGEFLRVMREVEDRADESDS